MSMELPKQPTHPQLTALLRSLMKHCWDGNPQSRPETSALLDILRSYYLMFTWHRVGFHVYEAAAELFVKSKKTLVGDGTYIGFVNAVLDRVPNTSMAEEDASSFGYPIYAQTGPLVTERVTDIMPGDIITIRDANLKGRRVIRTYRQTAGVGTPVVAVIMGYEREKSRVKAYQANGRVGDGVCHTINPASTILMRPFSLSRMSVTGWGI